ncbi:MAG: UbiX family flavin prenyltransferase [Proteobacteria bacterium]|nr:UbiX family flavin prenyltransferase [Pseudomonadota bacterium]MBU1714105.1 UbiX family flavin prenyltransferase [Pseudomonadota bacterium]
MQKKKRIILAITGATGTLYALEFLKLMKELNVEVHGLVSDAARKVMELELGSDIDLSEYTDHWHDVHDFTAPMASGSAAFDAMVVLPCSMGSLAAIANGISANLIHRAADVTLKERRPLILAVRETPFNRTHLKNMLKANDAGAIICPPMPAFYHKIDDFNDLARIFAGRLAGLLGVQVPDQPRWGS